MSHGPLRRRYIPWATKEAPDKSPNRAHSGPCSGGTNNNRSDDVGIAENLEEYCTCIPMVHVSYRGITLRVRRGIT
jgi:hypothetical protein